MQMRKAIFRKFFTFIEEDMEAIDRGGNTYEIVQKGYGKGTACDVILQKIRDGTGSGICIWRQYE